MMNFKRMLSVLGLLILSAVTFIACEQDFSQDEVEFGVLKSEPKGWSAITCTPNDGDTAIRTACSEMNGSCKKKTSCGDVNSMTATEYEAYRLDLFYSESE